MIINRVFDWYLFVLHFYFLFNQNKFYHLYYNLFIIKNIINGLSL